MVKFLLTLAVLYLLLTVQCLPFFNLSVFGFHPDLLLLATACLGLLKGEQQGALIGFLAGLGQDLCSGGVPGFNAAAKTLVGFVSGRLSQRVMGRSVRTQVANAAAMVILHAILIIVLARLFDFPRPASSEVIKALLVELSAGVLLVIPLFFLFERLAPSLAKRVEV